MGTRFVNKRSILFGEDEDSEGIIDTVAIPGLDGVLVVQNVNIQLSSPFDSGELSGSQSATTGTLVSATITPTSATNKVRITARIDAGSGTGVPVIEIREGSTVLVDTDVDQGATPVIYTLSVDLTDVSVAAHTYTLRIRFISGSFQYGNGGTTDTNPDVIAPLLVVALTDFADTHAGSIATPATATKQINVADSHTTKDSEVLS